MEPIVISFLQEQTFFIDFCKKTNPDLLDIWGLKDITKVFDFLNRIYTITKDNYVNTDDSEEVTSQYMRCIILLTTLLMDRMNQQTRLKFVDQMKMEMDQIFRTTEWYKDHVEEKECYMFLCRFLFSKWGLLDISSCKLKTITSILPQVNRFSWLKSKGKEFRIKVLWLNNNHWVKYEKVKYPVGLFWNGSDYIETKKMILQRWNNSNGIYKVNVIPIPTNTNKDIKKEKPSIHKKTYSLYENFALRYFTD